MSSFSHFPFIHTFIQAISIAPLQVFCIFVRMNKVTTTTTQRRPRHSTDTVSKFHAEAPETTASEGLAQGPYEASRARVEPTTLRTIGFYSTSEPPRPTAYRCIRCIVSDNKPIHSSISLFIHSFIHPLSRSVGNEHRVNLLN